MIKAADKNVQDRMVEIVGQQLADKFNLDQSQAVEGLKIAVKRQTFYTLDYLGISARSVRDAMNELIAKDTDIDRKEAFFEATMKCAKEALGND